MADFPVLKNSAQTIRFPLFDSSGYLTGASPTVLISIDDGTFAPSTNTPSEVATASGIYKLALTAGETNGDWIMFKITATGASPVFIQTPTVVRQLKDLAFPTVAGRSVAVSIAGEVDANVAKWLTGTPNALQSGRVDSYTGAMAAGVITSTVVDATLDVYTAIVTLTLDSSNTKDRYLVEFYKNAVPCAHGDVTGPTISVYTEASGSLLINTATLTEVATLGFYAYDEGTNRITRGLGYYAKTSATIGGSTRTWVTSIVTRDI